MEETGRWSEMQMQVLRCCPKEGRKGRCLVTGFGGWRVSRLKAQVSG